MFDKFFSFRLADKKSNAAGFTVHLFVFRTPRKRAIIFEAHLHERCPLAVVKFYDKAHRLSDNPFSLMSGSHEAAPTIRTAVEIMLYLVRENPLLSFAFIGAADPDGDTKETRRFRIYRGMLYRLFSEQYFQHLQMPGNSLYILLNRVYIDTNPGGQEVIFATLQDIYPEYTDNR